MRSNFALKIICFITTLIEELLKPYICNRDDRDKGIEVLPKTLILILMSLNLNAVDLNNHSFNKIDFLVNKLSLFQKFV